MDELIGVIYVADGLERCNRPGFNPGILRHNGIGGAADEAVLNKVLKNANTVPFQ